MYVVNPCDIGVTASALASALPVAGTTQAFSLRAETFDVSVPAPSSLLFFRIVDGVVNKDSLPDVSNC